MQKWRQIMLCAAFSFMFLFIAVGYAQLTDNLVVEGTAEVPELQAVYITNIEVGGSGNISNTPVFTKSGNLTFTHNDYTLNQQPSNGGAGGKVIIKVTVKNNSGKPQYISELSTTLDPNSDLAKKYKEYCRVTCAQTGEDRRVDHGYSKTYTFTIQNTKKQGWNTNYNLSMKGFESLLVFTPQLDANDTENATKAMVKAFAYILAGKGPDGDENAIITFRGKQYTAKQLVPELLLKAKDNGGAMNSAGSTGGYMGNVDGAEQFQKDLIDDMFGENMEIEIGSNTYSVTVLIKNQQLDDQGDNDMVIYITADQLFQGSGGWEESNRNNGWKAGYHNLNYVPVYALVYIKKNDGYWYCEHLFEGQAPVCDYGGAFGDGKVGNFNTNLWVSNEYNVSDRTATSDTVNKDYIDTNGELDEAYLYYRDNISNKLIHVEDLLTETTASD